MRRLVTFCELYLSKIVEKENLEGIEKADIDVIGLLALAQQCQANQLAAFLLHFVSTNYGPMSKRAEVFFFFTVALFFFLEPGLLSFAGCVAVVFSCGFGRGGALSLSLSLCAWELCLRIFCSILFFLFVSFLFFKNIKQQKKKKFKTLSKENRDYVEEHQVFFGWENEQTDAQQKKISNRNCFFLFFIFFFTDWQT